MRKPRRTSGWLELKNGNHWRHVEDGDGVTVFYSEYADYGDSCVWKWVYDGDYHGEWGTAEDAMNDAEATLDLN
jgi:hypothetical protein